MKSILTILLLTSVLQAIGQNDSVSVVYSRTLTDFGKPVSNVLTRDIGTEGGKIISADKRLELLIPPGALTARTSISITPVNNMAAGGRGNAYKLEPSGIQFQQPAQILFHYSEDDYNGSMEEMQSIAYQDDNGQWHRLGNVNLDTIAKTITGNITHFSFWATFDRSEIKPSADLCAVGAQVPLTIIVNNPPPDPASGDNDEDLLAAPQVPNPKPRVFVWSVNGTVGGGGGKYGSVSPVKGNNVTYTAPASVPPRNPVEVSVEAKDSYFILNGKRFNKLKLVSNIKIFDHFHYTYIAKDLIGHLYMIDSSTCDIKLQGDKVIMYNITNHPAWSDWPAQLAKCKYTYPDKDSWRGMVEMSGIANASSTVDKLIGILKVHISLIPATGNTPASYCDCPGGKFTVPAKNMPASPVYIGFTLGLRRDDVYIDYGNAAGYNEINTVRNGQGFIIRMKAY